jgi:hypothetical protein
MSNNKEPTSFEINRDRINVERSVSMIMDLMNRYIPHACRTEAYHTLCTAFEQYGLEITNKAMRKEYEAWKNLSGPSGLFSKPE